MVTKLKKITVKSFLNTRLPYKTETFIANQYKDVEDIFYPIYIQATYNRKSTQFKSCLTDKYIKSFGELTKTESDMLDEQIRTVHSIISYEANILGNNTPLKDLNGKYQFYSKDIIEKLREYIMNRYFRIVLKTRSEYMRLLNSVIYHKIPFSTFIKATRKLIPDFDSFMDNETKEVFDAYQYINNFLPKTGLFAANSNFQIIDWYDGSIQTKIKNSIIRTNNSLPSNHYKYIGIIDKIIKENK